MGIFTKYDFLKENQEVKKLNMCEISTKQNKSR